MTLVKICGISEPKSLKTACDAGADFIGFVFYPPSPRNVSLDTARKLAQMIPPEVKRVGLFVNPTDPLIEKTLKQVPLDIIQLHGEEKPQRVKAVKNSFRLPIIKAISVSDESDLIDIGNYDTAADWLLFDTKIDGEQGGTGKSFDWALLDDMKITSPWMVSGGLSIHNVSEAVKRLQPGGVDVSSGVESERGKKDPQKIHSFIHAVKSMG